MKKDVASPLQMDVSVGANEQGKNENAYTRTTEVSYYPFYELIGDGGLKKSNGMQVMKIIDNFKRSLKWLNLLQRSG